jgi:Pvc16 N-terminal domain/Carboxypeptidase regulatory-like domain
VSATTNVSRNTMLADLDETLRALLKRELYPHRLDVDVKFDAPNKEWAAALTTPTINAFLYDLRASKDHRPVEWKVEKRADNTREHRPPLMLDASYAVSVWTRAVEDEHRLLSQVLAILNAYPELPQDVLTGGLAEQPYPLATRLAQPKADAKADFWSSVGGAYKASLDYTVTLACPSGMTLERGPEVRTQTVRMVHSDGPRSAMLELHRVGGTVTSPEGEPIANAWVVLPGAGKWTATTREGRFGIDRLTPGSYECLVRSPDGQEARAELIVPGHGVDIAVGEPAPRTRRRR